MVCPECGKTIKKSDKWCASCFWVKKSKKQIKKDNKEKLSFIEIATTVVVGIVIALAIVLAVYLLLNANISINVNVGENAESSNSETGKQEVVSKPTYSPAPTNDPDPIIACSVSANCGGGTVNVRQSACSNTTCCQIGDEWVFYYSNLECEQDQTLYEQSRKENIRQNNLRDARDRYYDALDGFQDILKEEF